jgi:hypothetical protein
VLETDQGAQHQSTNPSCMSLSGLMVLPWRSPFVRPVWRRAKSTRQPTSPKFVSPAATTVRDATLRTDFRVLPRRSDRRIFIIKSVRANIYVLKYCMLSQNTLAMLNPLNIIGRCKTRARHHSASACSTTSLAKRMSGRRRCAAAPLRRHLPPAAACHAAHLPRHPPSPPSPPSNNRQAAQPPSRQAEPSRQADKLEPRQAGAKTSWSQDKLESRQGGARLGDKTGGNQGRE